MSIQIKPPCNGLTKFERWLNEFFPGVGNYATSWRVASEFLEQSTLECPLVWEKTSDFPQWQASIPFGLHMVIEKRGDIYWAFNAKLYEINNHGFRSLEAAQQAAQEFVDAELNGGG